MDHKLPSALVPDHFCLVSLALTQPRWKMPDRFARHLGSKWGRNRMARQSQIRVQVDTVSAANMPGYPCFTPSAQKMPYQIAESGAFRHVPSSAMARSTISRETPVSTMSSVDCAMTLPILSTKFSKSGSPEQEPKE